MIVAEIHAHRRAGRRHQLVELEAVAVAPVDGDGVGAVVDGGEELAVVLLDASGVAADAALAVRRQGLKQDVRVDIIDLDLVRHRIVGHDHGQRHGAMAGLNARDSCGAHEERRRTAKAYQSGHTATPSSCVVRPSDVDAASARVTRVCRAMRRSSKAICRRRSRNIPSTENGSNARRSDGRRGDAEKTVRLSRRRAAARLRDAVEPGARSGERDIRRGVATAVPRVSAPGARPADDRDRRRRTRRIVLPAGTPRPGPTSFGLELGTSRAASRR